MNRDTLTAELAQVEKAIDAARATLRACKIDSDEEGAAMSDLQHLEDREREIRQKLNPTDWL